MTTGEGRHDHHRRPPDRREGAHASATTARVAALQSPRRPGLQLPPDRDRRRHRPGAVDASCRSSTSERRANAAYLSQHLRGVITPTERPGCRHVYHQYTIRVPSPEPDSSQARDALAARLEQAGIQTTVYYPIPIHQQPYYRDLGYNDSLPVAERLSREVLSLPVHPALTQDDLKTIVAAVNDSIAGGRR